jgi:tryptophan 2,3-dioxygenase
MSRAPQAASCPFTGVETPTAGGTPYARFACLDELHQLQFPSSDSNFELSFILVTQVKELLFRMLHVELDVARAALREDDIDTACGALARGHRVQHVLLTTWETLCSMSASEFVAFRPTLGEASGIQSTVYRALEAALGNKEDISLEPLRMQGTIPTELLDELAAPSVYDEAIFYLHRTVRPMPARLLERDVSRTHVWDEVVEQGWLDVYREPRDHPEAYRLAEAMIDVAYRFSQWRATHLLVVERMLGNKPGTGGTQGVDWLRRVSEHRFFPELWSVRTAL